MWWPCRPAPMGFRAPSPMPTGAIPGTSTPATAGAAISGNRASARLRWTRSIWRRRWPMSSPIRCAPGLWPGPRRGAGRARRAYLAGAADGLTATGPMLSRFPDFAAYLEGQPPSEAAMARLRKAEQSGRPLGSPDFIEILEKKTARRLTPQKRGPKPRPAGVKKRRKRVVKSKVSR
jgi:hypothetical protein